METVEKFFAAHFERAEGATVSANTVRALWQRWPGRGGMTGGEFTRHRAALGYAVGNRVYFSLRKKLDRRPWQVQLADVLEGALGITPD